jgi:predicted metal-dependent hydrolase
MPKQLALLYSEPTSQLERDGLEIRRSQRARRLLLQVRPPYSVEVVVPRWAKPADVEDFVSRNRAWIERAQQEIRTRYPQASRSLPEHVALPAIDRQWPVVYLPSNNGRSSLRRFSDRLELRVPHNGPAVRLLLRDWVAGQGRDHLKPWLGRVARDLALQPKRVQVRTQKSRWGSCSSTGTLSINACLLFLEPALVRYLMIHELCHLRHLNHSRRYWALVERFEPDYRALDKRLGEAWADVPFWALPH